MQRIIIVGDTGSGKTTLAQQLAKKLGLTYIDLDDLFHLPGWQERPTAEFRALVDAATQSEKWIVAGTYFSKTQDITWPRADTLIYLDMPLASNFWQLLKRTVRRSYQGEIICNGNREAFVKQFLSKNSILLAFLKKWQTTRKRYGGIFAKPEAYPHLGFIRLQSYRQARDFLDKAG
jgi:adenylate kinase family enzyme